jgi:hypothetical protein
MEARTDIEDFLLARLKRFAMLGNAADLSGAPEWRRLARRATLSAYRDCVAAGLEDQARSALHAQPTAYRR